MFLKFRTPPWGLVWVALAALFFIYCLNEANAQSTGSWSFQAHTATVTSGGIRTITMTPPPVCKGRYSSKEEAVGCLINKKWDFGWYASKVGSGENRSHLYGVIFEGFGSSINSNNSCGSGCFLVGDVRLYDTNHNALNQNSYDRYPFFSGFNGSLSGSTCTGNCGGNSLGGASQYPNLGNNGVGFSVRYNANEPPSPDPSDDSCEGKSITLSMSAAEYISINPQAGTEVNNGSCVAIWEKPRGTPASYTSACLSPIGGSTLCFAKGLYQLAESEPSPFPDVSPDAPLIVGIGNTAAEQKALKAPDTAKELIGWGGAFGKLIPVASQLPIVGSAIQIASNIEPALWSAWLNSYDDGLVKFEIDYRKEQSSQDYYHPGNHTQGGNYLGAFDRDWDQTPYDASKAWNWGNTPAIDTPVEQLEVIQQPDGAATSGGNTYVTNTTNTSITNIHYPPGVTPPNGQPTPPPDGSAPDPSPPDDGGYVVGSQLYTPKYPDGIAGVWAGFKDEIMAESGIGEFLNAFRMPTGQATSDLCFNIDFNMGKIINLGEQGFCISENIILIVRALLIISAFIVARRLVFGG